MNLDLEGVVMIILPQGPLTIQQKSTGECKYLPSKKMKKKIKNESTFVFPPSGDGWNRLLVLGSKVPTRGFFTLAKPRHPYLLELAHILLLSAGQYFVRLCSSLPPAYCHHHHRQKVKPQKSVAMAGAAHSRKTMKNGNNFS